MVEFFAACFWLWIRIFAKVFRKLAMTGITLRNNCRTHLIRAMAFKIRMIFFFSFGGSSMLYFSSPYDNHLHLRSNFLPFRKRVLILNCQPSRVSRFFFSDCFHNTAACIFKYDFITHVSARARLYGYFTINVCTSMMGAKNDSCWRTLRTVPIEFKSSIRCLKLKQPKND